MQIFWKYLIITIVVKERFELNNYLYIIKNKTKNLGCEYVKDK